MGACLNGDTGGGSWGGERAGADARSTTVVFELAAVDAPVTVPPVTVPPLTVPPAAAAVASAVEISPSGDNVAVGGKGGMRSGGGGEGEARRLDVEPRLMSAPVLLLRANSLRSLWWSSRLGCSAPSVLAAAAVKGLATSALAPPMLLPLVVS